LIITGRRKDVIVAGGVTIWAREIEEALEADPRVTVAAVVARPHPAYGEVPVAFVEGAISPEEALAGLTARLARPKLPHQVVVLAALPRTPLGKVDKQQLREAACGASR
jgi:acyl-CoA synthetase (AMP-forming)/AMP-acid ligase II